MFKEILKYEGPGGLVRGIEAAFYGAIIYGFTYFYFYKKFKEHYKTYIGESSAKMFMICSFMTQSFALIIFYPFDMIKVRLQTSNHIFKYKGLKDAFTRIYYQNGNPSGWFIGLPVYMLTYISNFTLQLTIYEILTARYKRNGDFKRNEYACVFKASSMSGYVKKKLVDVTF